MRLSCCLAKREDREAQEAESLACECPHRPDSRGSLQRLDTLRRRCSGHSRNSQQQCGAPAAAQWGYHRAEWAGSRQRLAQATRSTGKQGARGKQEGV